MKKYNVQNYIRYKNDLKKSMPPDKFYDYYTRDELIVKFLPLVENLARKFSTTQQASGVLSINDLIQIGSEGLIKAVDKLDWAERLAETEDIEKTLKSFFAKRIKGIIRRRIDMARGGIRIPEHKLNEIRKNPKDKKMVELFFNSMFLSIDAQPTNNDEENMIYQIADKSEPYNIQILNIYLKGLMQKYLNKNEYEVLRLSYGLDCEKHSANEIADKIKIKGPSAYVRISELKKQAVEKLIDSVDHSQVLDFL
jgi:RNA polymerase sigma factor (sigma-70 family)